MSFKRGAFNRNEPTRRGIRDQMRTNFFEELGLDPIKNTLLIDVDIEAQARLVARLIAIARELHGEETSAIDLLGQELNSLQLGSSTIERVRRTTPDPIGMNLQSLSQHFFYTYRG